MKSFISFFLVFALTSLFAFVTGKAIVYVLMVFELLLVLTLIQYGLWIKGRIRSSIILPASYMAVKAPFEMIVKLENKSKLPVSRIKVECTVEDFFSKEVVGLTGSGMLTRKGNCELHFQVNEEYYSKMTVSLKSVKMFDPLGLFSWECEKKGKSQIFYTVPGIQEYGLDFQSGNQYSSDESYSNPSNMRTIMSDMYELDEFKPGNTLRQIHWKLSAKNDKFIVRDYIGSQVNQVLVVLNPYKENGQIERQEWDAFIKRVSDACFQLLNENIDFAVEWSCLLKGDVSILIESKEDIIRMLCECIECLQKGDTGFDKWNEKKESAIQEIIEIDLYKVAYRTRR